MIGLDEKQSTKVKKKATKSFGGKTKGIYTSSCMPMSVQNVKKLLSPKSSYN